jgi:hypothetical protein
MSNDIWTALAAPLPKDAIQQRQGPGGKMLDYIDWPFIQHRLDEVVPGEWSLKLEDIHGPASSDEPFACKASLTVRGVTRENIGTGKDWKEAATDASKRAAVRFGIGLELYQKGATARPQTAPASGGTRSSAPAPTPASPAPQAAQGDDVPCPKCGGKTWDNRATKRNPKAPDFKCRDKSCDGVVWPERASRAPAERPIEDILVPEAEDGLPF